MSPVLDEFPGKTLNVFNRKNFQIGTEKNGEFSKYFLRDAWKKKLRSVPHSNWQRKLLKNTRINYSINFTKKSYKIASNGVFRTSSKNVTTNHSCDAFKSSSRYLIMNFSRDFFTTFEIFQGIHPIIFPKYFLKKFISNSFGILLEFLQIIF